MWKRIGKLLLLLPLIVWAGELNFSASVDKTELGLDDYLTLTVTVSGENVGSVPSPKLPELSAFDIGGQSSSQSTSIQIINGRMTQRQTINFIYTLYPKKTGKFTIGSCTLEYKNNIYKTEPIEITVVKGTTRTRPAPGRKGPAPSMPSSKIEDNIKLSAVANRNTVYQGEQVIVEFSLYTRVEIQDLNLVEMPSFQGFWVEPIYDAKRVSFQRQNIKGRIYNVCLLKKCALFPVTTGKLKVSPMKMDVVVVQPPRDFFDFFGTTKRLRLESRPIYIKVQPLPAKDRPEYFTGAVGKFTIQASLDRTTSEGGEPINLTIRVKGTGNLKLIGAPEIKNIAGVKILDPEIKENIKVKNNRVTGYKEFSYPLIPETDGEYIVPRIRFAYFNPKDKSYHTIETRELKFTAVQTSKHLASGPATHLEVLGTDINYIKPDLKKLNDQLPEFGWLIFIYLGSLFMIGGAVLYRQHQSRLIQDRAYARRLRSNRLVKKRLKKAEEYLKKGEKKEFYSALASAITGYIGDRFNLDVGALTSATLLEELNQHGVPEETARKVIESLNRCDQFRFSPRMQDEDPGEILKEVRKLLNQL